MPITQAQMAAAEQQQWSAAADPAPQVCLVAGPGTGKSKTIEKRVASVLNAGATPQNVYVISFTVAASKELEQRVTAFCANQPCAQAAVAIAASGAAGTASTIRPARCAPAILHAARAVDPVATPSSTTIAVRPPSGARGRPARNRGPGGQFHSLSRVHGADLGGDAPSRRYGQPL